MTENVLTTYFKSSCLLIGKLLSATDIRPSFELEKFSPYYLDNMFPFIFKIKLKENICEFMVFGTTSEPSAEQYQTTNSINRNRSLLNREPVWLKTSALIVGIVPFWTFWNSTIFTKNNRFICHIFLQKIKNTFVTLPFHELLVRTTFHNGSKQFKMVQNKKTKHVYEYLIKVISIWNLSITKIFFRVIRVKNAILCPIQYFCSIITKTFPHPTNTCLELIPISFKTIMKF